MRKNSWILLVDFLIMIDLSILWTFWYYLFAPYCCTHVCGMTSGGFDCLPMVIFPFIILLVGIHFSIRLTK